uniref:Zona pellucida sperm-binding protein 4 n=1 Tax=Sparus aurata TaxID=8175 RepID=Q3ZE28_SPAAU|nr:zona pellucida protein Bb [Sparus aurata]
MAKHWNTATLVALALLGCFIGTGVEAQGWPKPQPPTSPQILTDRRSHLLNHQRLLKILTDRRSHLLNHQRILKILTDRRSHLLNHQRLLKSLPTAGLASSTTNVSSRSLPTAGLTSSTTNVSSRSSRSLPTAGLTSSTTNISSRSLPTAGLTSSTTNVSSKSLPTAGLNHQPFLKIRNNQRSHLLNQTTFLNIRNNQRSHLLNHQPFLNIRNNQRSPLLNHHQRFLKYSTINLLRSRRSLSISDSRIKHSHLPSTSQVVQSNLLSRVGRASNMRIPCGHNDISAAGCEAINCCFNGQQCYFGKAVTVQCTKDAQFIVVEARDATLPNIDLESISLLGQGQGCTHVDSNSEFAIYQFPVTGCGSVVMEEPGVIIYENRMSSAFEVQVGDFGAITRDSSYELLFQCRYTALSVETLVVEVLPLQDPPLPVAALGPISVHLRLANGQCNTKGCNEVSAAYTSFYTETDYPVVKVLRDPVYVEVLLLDKTDPALVLTLGHCWTTTSPNPHSLPQWDILIDGCPNRDDRYLSQLVPVDASSGLEFPGHFRRFIFKMFTFVDNSKEPLREQVYIHCSTAVCSAAPGRNCEPSCHRKGKRAVKAEVQRPTEPKAVVSVGPVIMSTPEE